MQISKKQGGWSKSHENKPIIKKEIFLNPIRKVICGRNLKGIGKPRSMGPAQFSLTMTLNLFYSHGNVFSFSFKHMMLERY